LSVYQLPGPHDLFQSFFNDKWDKLCDGQYDIKFIFDDNGASRTRYVYIYKDGTWQHCDDGSTRGIVRRDSVWLAFAPGEGWLETVSEEYDDEDCGPSETPIDE
jgi:hypothetical protein